MSFIITVHVGEGIVMASDSKATYNQMSKTQDGEVIRSIGVHSTNTMDKTFLCPNKCGISTCGDASIKGEPITGYIQSFIRENVFESTKITEMPELILDYFSSFTPIPSTTFILAGYTELNGHLMQKIYRVRLASKKIEDFDTKGQGAVWDGETLILTKLLQPVFLKESEDKFRELPNHRVPFNYFTLQDAVDFAKYAVDVTINTMRFHNVVETVGGPVDILVIKADESFWIQKKVLQP